MMTTVILGGEMGRRFGRRHRFDIRTPQEAVRALMATVEGFRAWMVEHKDDLFNILVGKEGESWGTEQILDPLGGRQVRIQPAVTGAGGENGGLLQTVVGVALIAIGVAFPEVGFLTNVGIALAVGGVSRMLFSPPQQGMDGPQKPENTPSYLFSGPVNVIQEGGCVPVCYGGPIEVGSVVISGSIRNQNDMGTGGFGGGTGGGGCPVQETPITMEDGSERPAGELRTGDLIRTHGDMDLQWGTAPIVVGEAQLAFCSRVVLEDGREIVVSRPHRFLRYRADVDLYDYREAALLEPGDMLAGERQGVVKAVEDAGQRLVIPITTERLRTYQTAGITSHNIKNLIDVTDI